MGRLEIVNRGLVVVQSIVHYVLEEESISAHDALLGMFRYYFLNPIHYDKKVKNAQVK